MISTRAKITIVAVAIALMLGLMYAASQNPGPIDNPGTAEHQDH